MWIYCLCLKLSMNTDTEVEVMLLDEVVAEAEKSIKKELH